jgi:hypothetical protein
MLMTRLDRHLASGGDLGAADNDGYSSTTKFGYQSLLATVFFILFALIIGVHILVLYRA